MEEKKTTLERETYNGTQVVRAGESTVPAFEKTCWKCGTKFLYISDAIKHDKDGDYVICPSCGAFISHQENPKTADFISPKCTSDAKGEDRSQKHSDSITTLEEAAEINATKYQGEICGSVQQQMAAKYDFFQGFIAGVKWKEQQDDKETADLLAIARLQGMEQQKKEMMKEAVEGKVFMSFAPGHNHMVMADVDLPLGTKVKIIIVKSDESA